MTESPCIKCPFGVDCSGGPCVEAEQFLAAGWKAKVKNKREEVGTPHSYLFQSALDSLRSETEQTNGSTKRISAVRAGHTSSAEFAGSGRAKRGKR